MSSPKKIKFRELLGALVAGKSMASFAAAFARGDDVGDGPSPVHLTNPMAQSSWVFAGTSLIADEIASVDLDFYDGDNEVTDAAFLKWWDAPALDVDKKRIARADVEDILTTWAKLKGEFFLLFDDSWVITAGRTLQKGTALAPFIIARPDRIDLIITGSELLGYRWTDAGGRQHQFVPEQVIHWKKRNPLDPWRGLGIERPAHNAIEGDFLAGAYVANLMRNNGDQGFIVSAKGSAPLDDPQKEQIVAQLRAKRRALAAGVARDIFLTSEVAVDHSAAQAADADLNATRLTNRHEIYIALGIPPSLCDVKASYSTGKDSDRYQLISGTCMPLSKKIAGIFSMIAQRQTGRPINAKKDWDEHPVMQEVRRERIDTAIKLWNVGMPMQLANDYLDLNLPEFAGWEIPYLPFSVSPVPTDGLAPTDTQPTTDPALAEGKELVPELAHIRLLLAARAREREVKNVAPTAPPVSIEAEVLKGFTCGCDAKGLVAQKADRDPKEIARWREHMKARRETAKAFESAFGRVLMAARIETLRKIERNSSDKKSAVGGGVTVAKDGAATDLIFSLSDFTDAFKAAMRKQQKTALEKAGSELLKEIGKDDPFALPPEAVKAFIAERENKLAGVPDSVFEKIRAALQEGIDKGDSTADLTSRVKQAFNGVAQENALRIAQTETAAAYGAGRQQAMETAGVRYKAWLTSGNSNVRVAHVEAGLTYSQDSGIPIDEPFIVDGEELMHPGDSNGSPGNVINCHCVSIAVDAPSES